MGPVWVPKRGQSPAQAPPPATPLISHVSSLQGLLLKKITIIYLPLTVLGLHCGMQA